MLIFINKQTSIFVLFVLHLLKHSKEPPTLLGGRAYLLGTRPSVFPFAGYGPAISTPNTLKYGFGDRLTGCISIFKIPAYRISLYNVNFIIPHQIWAQNIKYSVQGQQEIPLGTTDL